jgi:hypothetical protein
MTAAIVAKPAYDVEATPVPERYALQAAAMILASSAPCPIRWASARPAIDANKVLDKAFRRK